MKVRSEVKRFLAWYLPEPTKVLLYRIWQKWYDIRLDFYDVKYRTNVENIYYCTVHKAGSQWFNSLLLDPVIYQWCGLKPWFRRVMGIDVRNYHERYYTHAFPARRIVTSLYINFDAFRMMPKPSEYRAFFVMRNPRDLTVSYYFSMAFTHTPMGDIPQKRAVLRSMEQREGIMWTIKYLNDYGLYEALRSWSNADAQDPNVKVFQLEDISGPSATDTVTRLLRHCDIRVPLEEVGELLNKYSFKAMKARDHRRVDGLSHYRSGKPGDWKRYFDDELENYFRKITGDLVEFLGYGE